MIWRGVLVDKSAAPRRNKLELGSVARAKGDPQPPNVLQ